MDTDLCNVMRTTTAVHEDTDGPLPDVAFVEDDPACARCDAGF